LRSQRLAKSYEVRIYPAYPAQSGKIIVFSSHDRSF